MDNVLEMNEENDFQYIFVVIPFPILKSDISSGMYFREELKDILINNAINGNFGGLVEDESIPVDDNPATAMPAMSG